MTGVFARLLLTRTLTLLLTATSFPCLGEPSGLPQAVTIHQLLQIVREKSPRLAAERAQIDIASAELVAAEVLPNPAIGYGRFDLVGGKNTLFEGSQQQQTIVDIPLLIAGQRPARREAAQRGVSAAKAQVQARYVDLARQSWQLFVKLLTGQERVRVLEEARSQLGQVKDIVTGRTATGMASQYDVLRITVETTALDTRASDAQTEVTNSAGEIGALLGLPGWRPKALGALASLGVEEDIGALWDKAMQLNPSLEAARKEELAAEAGIQRAKRERWPVPVVSLGNLWTNNPFGSALFAGLSVEVPLFDRGQGSIARAQAGKRSTALLRQSLTAETRAELERAVDLLRNKKDTLRRFERDALTKLPNLQQMAEAAYRLGKATLLELLDATRSRTELRLNHLELVEAVIQAEIDTLATAGLLDTTGL